MNLSENWLHIVEDNDEKAIIPFLQKLNEAQKNSLLPQLNKTAKTHLEIKDRLINNKHFYTKKASTKQERILNYSIFVCLPDQSHPLFKWLNVQKIITPFTVKQLISWYCPTWFNTYLNEFGQQNYIPANITYDLVMQLTELGQIKPNKALVAKLLPMLIFTELPEKKWVYQFQPQHLIKNPITLEQHLWYLFEQPSNIYNCNRYLKFVDQENIPKDCWFFALKTYVDAGHIDRIKLLTACLIACINPIFNKLAVGWFIRLFDYLRPTPEAILTLQKELFATFVVRHSKVLNTVLKTIKSIVESPNFLSDQCLINYGLLLRSKTKSVVNNALVVLEKIAKFHPTQQEQISILAAEVFVHRAENLQLSAAKIIQQFGQNNKKVLIPIIQQKANNLFQDALSILKDFDPPITKQLNAEQKIKPKRIRRLSAKNKIPSLTSFEAFQKLTLQIFEHQAVYHFDQFLASLLQFQAILIKDKINYFIPVFKRAYQLVFNELPSHQGMLDNILAIFFLDLGDYLIGKYPMENQPLRKIANTYLEQGFFINDRETPFDLNYAHLYGWYNPYDPSQVYMPIKKLLGYVLSCLHQEKSLPLLSTPTHAPTWVDPYILVQRLMIYQKQGTSPNPIDFQLAISRVAFENKKAALALAQTNLKKEYYELIAFLLNSKPTFPTSLCNKLLKTAENGAAPLLYYYSTAAITKNGAASVNYIDQLPPLNIPSSFFNGQHDWMVFWEERQFEEWNYKTQRLEYVGKPYIHTELQIKFPKGMNIIDHPDFLYQYFPGNDEAFRPNINDVQRLLSLLPNNPDPLFALLIADNLKYPEFWEEVARKRVLEMIIWLKAFDYQLFGKAIHLFLATCMLCADKKIRSAVGSIWKKAVSHNQLDSILLGQTLGRIERKAFAPLKRFTDLAQNELFKISPSHNRALEQTIAHLLAKLPAIPIKNTKNLLILYRELLILNKSTIKEVRLLVLLPLWMKSPSLKKVIKALVVFVDRERDGIQ